MVHLYRFLRLAVLLSALSHCGFAQPKTTRPQLTCGVLDLPQAELRRFDEAARSALVTKLAAGAFLNTITYVPIRPHIFRSAAGVGGIDVPKMNRVLAATNSYYLLNGYGIQFYFAGTTPDYIDNDATNATFVRANEEAIAGPRDVTNAMNMYFVNGFDLGGLGGYAYFPANALYSTRSFILNEAYEEDLGYRLLPHELGHNFNLYHTFQGSTSAAAELVTRGAGANCTTAGDLICDTPADPYNRPGATTTTINGCEVYNGTATDPQGAPYSPSISNLMSYFFPCTHDFTSGQHDRMAAGLALRQTHTAYTLNYPPTVVTAPANLSAVLSANGKSVSLTWQDLASNEMGYFVERSTRPTDGFESVGGTGPNGTSYTNNTVQGLVTYYYRIRPSNTTLGSLSPVVPVNVPVCRPTFAASCSVTNGLASVTVKGVALSTGSGCAVSGYGSLTTTSATVGAGQVVPFGATLLNATTALYTAVWADMDRNGAFDGTELLARTTSASTGPVALTLSLPASLTTGSLPLRVVSATTLPTDPCGNYAGGEAEDYALMVATVGSCPAPAALTTTSVTSGSAYVAWAASAGSTAYSVQYRSVGGATWTSVNGVISASLALAGLQADKAYEWQVLSICGATGSSVLSAAASFTTGCSAPTDLTTAPIYGNAGQLNWPGGAGNTYSVQWRPVGASTWTLVSGLPASTYILTGLTSGTAYEWQVAVNCLAGTSAYSAPVSFTTGGLAYYCRPALQSGCSGDDGLNGLKIGTFVMSQNSGCSPGAYQSYTLASATLDAGRVYSFTATLLSSLYSEGLALWVDLNRNGIFDTSERLFTSPTAVPTDILGSVLIPPGTAAGLYTLRARINYEAIPTDPCASVAYGETEDYVINVSNTPCIAPVATLSGSPTITAGQTASLTVALTGTAPWALTVSNDSSFTGITSSPFTLTVAPAATLSYSLVQVSNGCGTSGTVSGTAVVTVVACAVPTGVAVAAAIKTVSVAWVSQSQTTYRLEWRVAGGSTWPASLTSSSSPVSISGLFSATGYELRLQASCVSGSQSAYTTPVGFTTLTGADLSLDFTVNNRTPAVNEVVLFTGMVSNAGPQSASSVQVVSLLPPNMSFVGSPLAGITSGGGAVSVAVGMVPLLMTIPFSFSAKVSQPGTYGTAAQITTATPDDPDSFLNSGTSDGDDDAATVDLRTREAGTSVFVSPNPNPRVLPPVAGNQPPPGTLEADLSLGLSVSGRTPVSGAGLSVSVVVSNRGALTATGITVQVTLPVGWVVTNLAGLSVAGQVVSLSVASVVAGQWATVVIPVQASGVGEQTIRALITVAGQPDADSPHGNGYGLGEDDEATVMVRVR